MFASRYSYLAGMYGLSILDALCFFAGFGFLCLALFLLFLRNDGIKAERLGY